MFFLYLLNLAAYPAVLVFGGIYFTRYFRLSILNPLTLVLGASVPTILITSLAGPAVILEDGLFNIYFQYALLVSNVHELLGTAMLIFLVRYFSKKKAFSELTERIIRTGGPARPERMRVAALVFLGLYFVFFVLLAQHSFSVAEWIKNPRVGYQLHRTGAGQWYALAITSLSVSLVLATIYARSSLSVVVITPIYLTLIYILGSKGLVIFFGVYVLIILTVREYKYLPLMTVLVGSTAVILVVSNFVSTFGSVGLDSIANYSDGYSNASRYYQRYLDGSLPLYHGQIFFSSFWGIVPRALYPDKPYVYGVIKVLDVFYPGAAEQTNTPAFATVDYFADFGWAGVLLSALLNPASVFTALLYVTVLPRLRMLNIRRNNGHSRTLTYASLLLIAPSFLLFFDFPNNLILFVVIAGVIETFNRIRFTDGRSNKIPVPLSG